MKNFLSVLSSTLQGGIRGGLLILTLLATTSLWAYDFQSGDLYYNITSDSTVAVTYQEYNSSSNYASIYTVTVPETVTYDGTTYSVTSIGNYAFYGCSSLTSVTIPNSVTSIGYHAFYDCFSLTKTNYTGDIAGWCNIEFGNYAANPTYYSHNFYINDQEIKDLVIPNSVTSIGNYAFYGCSSLTSVTIPNSVTSIGYSAFNGCSSLTSITIPESVTGIGGGAFRDCSSLTTVTIPNSVTSIGYEAFRDCSSLTSVTIPNSVTSIGEWAFAWCSSLSTVFWNANLYDNNYTYWCLEYYWDSIDSVYMIYPELGIFDIGRFVEENMPFNEEEMCNDSPFNGCDGIKSFSFGENVEVIPDGLCYGLDGITSITIPESVSSIGERSFAECSSLDTIYCYSLTPPVIHDSYLTLRFDVGEHGASNYYEYMYYAPYIYDNITLCVPCQALEKYKSQEEYTIRFKNIQCSEDTTPPEPEIPTEGIGVFSVGEGKAVTFSRGNLQYHPATDEWRFAENQTDYIGDANSNCSSTYNGWLDLFGWSTSATNFGVNTSTSRSDYLGTFVDWGTNQIGADAPNTWRTLTYDEWDYLRHTRVNADALCGVAQVNGVSGLVFLPDNWACPDGVTFKSGFHSDDNVEAYGQHQTFTADQWSKLESAGAVFLPTAGYRYGSSVYNVQGNGYYWSTTELGSNYAYGLYFLSDAARMTTYDRNFGRSVRLVKDVNSTTPEPPTQPQDTTIYHPTEYVAICEGDEFYWRGWQITEAGTHTGHETVKDENYTYHHIYTLELTVIPFSSDTIVVEAYDSYVWHGRVYTESGVYLYEEYCYQEILELTIIDTPTPPEPEIPTEGIGVFSISEGKTVTFSRGNLQYTQSTQTWSFAENQYDYLGTANVSNGALADKIDLFGWSASNTTAPFGVSTSEDIADYYGSFVDWGTNKIGNDAPNTWRTLTDDEWVYVVFDRPSASSLNGVAQVNGVKGLILLPDNWTCPAGVTFKSGFHSSYGVEYYAAYQTFTADQWSKLEAAGAVFLPAAGYRYGSDVSYVQYDGYYWSATGRNSHFAGCLGFYSVETNMNGNDREYGQSVRLVKDVNSTTPEPPVEPETEWITIYTDIVICEYDLPFNWHVAGHTMICETAGTYTYEEIVEDENYIYHNIYTLELTVMASERVVLVEEAYDSYEWHGEVYTESGTYFYEEYCYQEILELTIIPSEDKEYVYGTYYQDLVCNGGIYVDPITGENYIISSLVPTSLTWSDTVKGTEVDTIHTFNITPIVSPEPLTEDMLYAIGSVPRLVAGEKVAIAGTTELIMAYYQMVDQHDIADVIGVEWVAGHDVVLDTEQTTHTMVLEVWDECGYRISKEFTFPVSKKDSEPQDTTICIYYTEDVTICEGEALIWMGMEYTETGTYTCIYKEIVEDEDYTYIYLHLHILYLTVLPYETIEYEVEAYDSFEWHGIVYTESGTYTYQYECTTEVLYLTIIPSEDNQGEVVVEPSTNSVTITWQKEDDADTYIIVIKQGDKVVCTLIFDAEGNLVSVNYLPGRESNKHGIQHAGLTSDSFQYTITGLTPSTDYTYTVTATDDSDNTISSYSGEFTTHHATSVENTNSQSPTIDCQKILYEDHIYILRDGKTYTIMGAEVK